MARIPTAARRSRIEPLDEATIQETLSEKVLRTVKLPGRPPKDEEERRETFFALIRMKATRLTNKECAERLGVSERTIANYIVDPLFKEVEDELQAVAKQAGYTLISEMVQDALSELYSLLKTGKSEFVRYKSAEKLLDVAGFNVPREEAQRDNREEVSRFLELVKTRASVNVQVNIQQVGGEGETKTQVVDAELAPYYRPVLPGGRIPLPEVPEG